MSIKLEVTGHLGVSALSNTVDHNLSTFVKKPKWSTATFQDINLYKQRVYVFIGVAREHCISRGNYYHSLVRSVKRDHSRSKSRTLGNSMLCKSQRMF